jgi:cobalt-zinc-cadmium efflux system membrane fusion protein
MNLRRRGVFKPIALTLVGLVMVAAVVAGVLFGLPLLRSAAGAEQAPASSDNGPSVNLVKGQSETIEVPLQVANKLKIKTAPVTAAKPRVLQLRGSLTFDPQQMTRIRSRFPGEVIELEQVRDPLASHEAGQSVLRPLRPGDPVKKGEVLAVVWSKDLGEKKSELVNALSQLYLDQTTLKNMEKSIDIIPEQRLREMRQQIESDFIAVDKARRTLESWRLTDEEIKEIEDEALRIRDRGGKRDPEKRKNWPRVDIASRIDGVIVEKNVIVGDLVPDSSFDLFKVANTDQLAVWANAYEEDLPAIQAYEKELQTDGKPLPWTIRLRGASEATAINGRVTRIGQVVDPVQHSIILEGTVDNKDHRLRAGENITAAITLPAAKGEVSIPIGALVEDGKESTVFVVTANGQFSLKRVHVTRRGLTEAQVQEGPVKKGDHVVSSGAIELKAALEDLQNAKQEQK